MTAILKISCVGGSQIIEISQHAWKLCETEFKLSIHYTRNSAQYEIVLSKL